MFAELGLATAYALLSPHIPPRSSCPLHQFLIDSDIPPYVLRMICSPYPERP